MFWNLVRSESLKFWKTKIWLLLFVGPVLASLLGSLESFTKVPELNEWVLLLMSSMIPLYGLLFLPLFSGVLASFVCRYEHANGAWKQLLSLPVTRRRVFLVKACIIYLFLAIAQLLFLAGWMIVGYLKGFTDPLPLEIMAKVVVGGWLASLPLATLQLGVSVAWASFAAPLALNVILTIPNMLVVNSETFGPFYPWVQPFLMMLPKESGVYSVFYMPLETLLFVILGSFLLFLCGGLIYFQRKAV